MAPLSTLVATILLVLALLLHVDHSSCHLLKASVACTDCPPNHDLTGVKVAVQCNNEKKRVSTLTNENGYFEIEVPATMNPSDPSPDCSAMLLGGPEQLCAYKKNMVSKIITVQQQSDNLYSLSTSLTFFTSCPSAVEKPKMVGDAKKATDVASTKTFGPFLAGTPPGMPSLPAMPPFYFFRFFPIIGIP